MDTCHVRGYIANCYSGSTSGVLVVGKCINNIMNSKIENPK